MKEEKHNTAFEEAEVIKTKKTSQKTKKRRAYDFAQGFAINHAFDRVDGVRKQMLLVAVLWTAGIVLGVIALVALIGVGLFWLLPNGIAGVILGIIAAPIVWGIYFVVKSINMLSVKTEIKRKK